MTPIPARLDRNPATNEPVGSAADAAKFVGEAGAYAILERAGIRAPRHALLGSPMPFKDGEPVVLKGLGEDLWHKSERDAVHFLDFDFEEIVRDTVGMRARVQEAGHRWLGALVCERVDAVRSGGLPSELLVSLSRSEAGWLVVMGVGGMGVETLAAHVKPLCWPVDSVSAAGAFAELEAHFLGGVLLGTQRGAKAITTRKQLCAMLDALWRLADIAESDGLSQLEMNPVVFDREGEARPLDAAGVRAVRAPARASPPPGFLECLLAPRSAAIAGVSSQPGGVGRTVLDNMARCPSLEGRIVLVKPGARSLFGFPCVPDVSALLENPVDLLVLATPAAAAAEALEQLIAQGGGAGVVGLVAGGIGDGADAAGLGKMLAAKISEARAAGRWTPAVLGANFMGHWVPGQSLDTTFIPSDKLAPPPASAGSLALLSQSGAFLLCRRSQNPGLGLLLGAALGNQMDVSLPDFLEALVPVAQCRAVAAYVEGFQPGQLAATVRAAGRLRERGVTLLMHRAGRTTEGQAAAASHTGAIIGKLVFERALLGRAGVRVSESVAAFDAALRWLSVYPQIKTGPVALVSNAGFECVTGSDAFAAGDSPRAGLSLAVAESGTRLELERMIEAEGLTGVVNPRLPLDLTPMAGEAAYLRAAEILVRSGAGILIIGIVPFTPRLKTDNGGRSFACALAVLARSHEKPVGVVIDAGVDYHEFKQAFVEAGLPVFGCFEDAVRGLRTLV